MARDTGRRFTADDVIDVVGLPGESEQNANNAVGALFSAASRAGVIHRVGVAHTSRHLGNGRALAVWQGGSGRTDPYDT
jgi:threonine dehydrogenase-like Zn-dependent dehydrogenase